MNFGTWQLLPIGRFDGGRIAYALFGRRGALILSWLSVAILLLMDLGLGVWSSVAIVGALTLIRLRRQHPDNGSADGVDTQSRWLAVIAFLILVLTFVPVPVRLVE